MRLPNRELCETEKTVPNQRFGTVFLLFLGFFGGAEGLQALLDEVGDGAAADAMVMEENRQFGYLYPCTDDTVIRQKSGQVVAGGAIGVLCHEKIAVLTANEESCTPDLLRACSVPDEVIERCVIRGLGKEPQFKVILDDSCEFDNAQIKQELLGKAEEIVREYPETGAFLLECTEMPPYAYLIQAATQCRVYDFITMLNWVHSGLCRRLFTGWV